MMCIWLARTPKRRSAAARGVGWASATRLGRGRQGPMHLGATLSGAAAAALLRRRNCWRPSRHSGVKTEAARTIGHTPRTHCDGLSHCRKTLSCARTCGTEGTSAGLDSSSRPTSSSVTTEAGGAPRGPPGRPTRRPEAAGCRARAPPARIPRCSPGSRNPPPSGRGSPP